MTFCRSCLDGGNCRDLLVPEQAAAVAYRFGFAVAGDDREPAGVVFLQQPVLIRRPGLETPSVRAADTGLRTVDIDGQSIGQRFDFVAVARLVQTLLRAIPYRYAQRFGPDELNAPAVGSCQREPADVAAVAVFLRGDVTVHEFFGRAAVKSQKGAFAAVRTRSGSGIRSEMSSL